MSVTGEVDMAVDGSAKRVLESDVAPMGIRPQWTAIGLCAGALAYAEWMRRQAAYGGGA